MHYSDDVRQMKWDSILIKGWHKDVQMRSLVTMYLKDLGEEEFTDEQFAEMRRFPKPWEQTTSARVFVARYIPKLSARLFDHPKDANFWLMMDGDKVNRQKSPADSVSRRQEVQEITQSQRHDAADKKRTSERTDLYSSHSRSGQWNVCK